MKSLVFAMLAVAVVPQTACQSNDLGTGTNTVDRDYAKSAPDVNKAVLQSAEAAGLKVIRNQHDQLGSEVVASRGDGKEVHILVKGVNDKSTHVSVRVEPGDRELATMIHERIAGSLGMGAATAGWFGGNSMESTYTADLTACTVSARRAIASLDPASKSEDIHGTWCQIDGRLKDATPIRIRLERVDDLKTRASFIAGSTKSDDNKVFVQKMKDSFEATTAPSAGSQ